MAKDKNKKKDGLFSMFRGKSKAEGELEELLERVQEEPNDMRVRLKLADAYFKNEEKNKALDQYLTVAETYADQGFYPKAVAVYKQLLTVEPKMIDVHIKLAGLYQKLGLMGEVVAQYQKAAEFYEAEGKVKQALDIMRRLVELSPDNVKGRIRLGQRYMNEGHREDALEQFMKAAEVFKKMEKTSELTKLYEGLLDRGFESYDMIREMADIFEDTKQYEHAVEVFSNLKGEMAGSVSIMEIVADMAEKAGRKDQAVHALHRVLDAYADSGRDDVILETCNRILTLDPEDEIAKAKEEQLRTETEAALEVPEIEVMPEEELSLEPEEQEEIPVEIEEPDEAEIAFEIKEPEVAADSPAVEAELEPESDELELEIDEVEEIPFEIEDDAQPDELPEPEPMPELEPTIIDDEPEPEEEEITFEMPDEVAEEMPDEPIEELPEMELDFDEDSSAEETLPVGDVDLFGDDEGEESAEENLFGDEQILRQSEAEQFEVDLAVQAETAEAEMEPEPEIEIELEAPDIPEEEADIPVETDQDEEVAPGEEMPELPDLESLPEPEPEPEDEPEPEVQDYEGMDPALVEKHLDESTAYYFNAGAEDAAVDFLRRVVDENPDNIQAHEKLLAYCDRIEDTDGASFAVDRLIDLTEQQNEKGRLLSLIERKLTGEPENLLLREKMVGLIKSDDPEKAVAQLLEMSESARLADDGDKAAAYLEQVLAIDPDHENAAAGLLEFRISFNDVDGALELLHTRAENAFNADDLADAAALHQRALELRPADETSNEALLDIFEMQDDRPALLAHLDKLADSALSKNENDRALELLNRMHVLEPENLDVLDRKREILLASGDTAGALELLFNASALRSEQGRFDEAENDLRLAVELEPKDTAPYRKLLGLYETTGNNEKTVDTCFTLAELSREANDLQSAEELLNKVLAIAPANVDALTALADLYKESDRTDQAVATLFTLAESYTAAGESSDAERTLREVTSLDPTSLEARLRLRDHFLGADDTPRAIIEIRQAADLEKGADHIDGAMDLYNQILNLDQGDIQARTALKDLLLGQDDQAGAIEQLLTLAVYHREAGNSEEAVDALREVLKLDADQIGAMESLAEIHIEQGQADKAVALWEKQAQKQKAAGQTAEAVEYYEKIVALQDDNVDARLALKDILKASEDISGAVAQLFALADLFLEKEKTDRAESALKEIIELEPADLAAQDRLKTLYLDSNQVDKAVALLFTRVEKDLEKGVTERARQTLDEVLSLLPDDSKALEMLAGIYIQEEDTDKAVELYLRLADLQSDDPELCQGRLEQVLELAPDHTDARRNLAELFIEQGQNKAAIDQLMSLADIHLGAQELDPAEAVLNRCVELDADHEGAWLALADLHQAAGQNQQAVESLWKLARARMERENTFGAEEMLNRILALDEGNTDALTMLSEIHIGSGDTDQAVRELFQLLQAAEEAGDFEDALDTAGKILELDENNEQVLLRRAGLYLNAEKADEAVADYFRLYDLYKGKDEADNAIGMMHKVLDQDAANRQAHDNLIETYTAAGNDTSAIGELFRYFEQLESNEDKIDVANRVLELDDSNEKAHARLAELYLESGAVEKAIGEYFALAEISNQKGLEDRFLEHLESVLKLDPTNDDAYNRQVALFEEKGDKDRALEKLNEFAMALDESDQSEKASDIYSRILEADPANAVALLNLKDKALADGDQEKAFGFMFTMAENALAADNPQDAEQALRSILEIAPDNMIAWGKLREMAQSTGDTVREIAVCFETLEKAEQSLEPLEKIDLLDQILALDEKNEKAMRRLRDLYKAENDLSAAVEYTFRLADVQSQIGKTDQLEEHYREVLRMDAKNVQAHTALVALYQDQGMKEQAAGEIFALADLAEESGDTAAAVDHLEQVIELGISKRDAYRKLRDIYTASEDSEKRIEVCFALADIAREKQDTGAWEKNLKEILSLEPRNLRAHAALKEIYLQQGDTAGAVSQLFALAEAANAAGDPEETVSYLEQIVEIDPANLKAHNRIKDHYLDIGDDDAALLKIEQLIEISMESDDVTTQEKLLRQAVELSPIDDTNYLRLVDLYEEQGETGKAVIELFNLIEMYTETERENQVKEPLERVIKIDRDNIEAHKRLRDIYTESGDKKAAIGELFALVRIASKDKKIKLAEKHLRQIFQIDPKNRKAKEKLAEVFMANAEQDEKVDQLMLEAQVAQGEGNADRAKEILTEILGLDPDHIDAKARLNALYLAQTHTAPIGGDLIDPFAMDEEAPAPSTDDSLFEATLPGDADADLLSDDFAKAADATFDRAFNEPEPEPEELFEEEDVFSGADDQNIDVEDVDVFGADTPAADVDLFEEAEVEATEDESVDLFDSEEEEAVEVEDDQSIDLFGGEGEVEEETAEEAPEEAVDLFDEEEEEEPAEEQPEQAVDLFDEEEQEELPLSAAAETEEEVIFGTPEGVDEVGSIEEEDLFAMDDDSIEVEDSIELFGDEAPPEEVELDDEEMPLPTFEAPSDDVAEDDGTIELFGGDEETEPEQAPEEEAPAMDFETEEEPEMEAEQDEQEEDLFAVEDDSIEVEDSIELFGDEAPQEQVELEDEEMPLPTFEAPSGTEPVEGEVDLFATEEKEAIETVFESGTDIEPESEEEPMLVEQESDSDVNLFSEGAEEEPEIEEEQAEEELEPEVARSVASDAEEHGDLFEDIFGEEPATQPATRTGTEGDAFDDLLSDLSEDDPLMETGGDDLFGDIIKDFKEGLAEQESKDAQTHFSLGVAYREIDSIEEAIAEFERALALGDPSMEFEIDKHLGECYYQLNQFDRAAQYLHSAIDAAEDLDEMEQLDLMVDLGQVYLEAGDFKNALEALTAVDEANANYRGVRELIAKAKKGSGDDGPDDDDNIGYV